MNNSAVIERVERAFRLGIRQGLQRTKIDLVGQSNRSKGIIQNEMELPKTGQIYRITKRNGRTVNHQASAPNESPAVLNGDLQKSVYGNVEGGLQLRIGANTPYAKVLHNGGMNNNGNYIAPRNYLIRPILKNRRNTINNIEDAIKKNL
jgi:phage gpG-like protein